MNALGHFHRVQEYSSHPFIILSNDVRFYSIPIFGVSGKGRGHAFL